MRVSADARSRHRVSSVPGMASASVARSSGVTITPETTRQRAPAAAKLAHRDRRFAATSDKVSSSGTVEQNRR